MAQLEEAASCARVVNVNVQGSGRASCVLDAGFRKNIVRRKVMLSLQTVLTTDDDDDDDNDDDDDETLLLKL